MDEMTTILPLELLSDYSTVKRLTCWRVGLKTYNLKLFESISVDVAFKILHIYPSLHDNKSIPMHILKVHEYLSSAGVPFSKFLTVRKLDVKRFVMIK